MILLTSTSDKLQLITTSTAPLDVQVTYVDLASGTTVSAGRLNTKITTATTTDILGSPGASTVRAAKLVAINNISASASNTVTFQHTDGTTVIQYDAYTLAPGERFSYLEGRGLKVINALGVERTVNSYVMANSNTADITTGAGTDTYLTGGSLSNIAPILTAQSHMKWKVRMTKTATGSTAPSFIVRVGTAGTVSDTARVTLAASGTATAATDTAFAEIDVNVRTAGSSGVLNGVMRFEHTAGANVGFGGAALQLVNATSAAFDLTTATNVFGLSLSPGTSAVATVQYVSVEVNTTLQR